MTSASKRSFESPLRFDLAAFFTAPKPCEDALLDLGIAYNRLADQVEEAWSLNVELVEALERISRWPAAGRAQETARAALAKAKETAQPYPAPDEPWEQEC